MSKFSLFLKQTAEIATFAVREYFRPLVALPRLVRHLFSRPKMTVAPSAEPNPLRQVHSIRPEIPHSKDVK